jgi:guanylate kinase
MQRRLHEASVELRRVNEFDYRVVNRNGQLDDAVREIDAIIAAEKCRVNPRLVQFL